MVAAVALARALDGDRKRGVEVLRHRELPLRAPARRAARHRPHLDRARAAGRRLEEATADEAEARVVAVVAFKLVDHHAHAAGGHELVEELVLEGQRDAW